MLKGRVIHLRMSISGTFDSNHDFLRSHFNSVNWAEKEAAAGWTVYHVCFINEEGKTHHLNICLRKVFLFFVIWIPNFTLCSHHIGQLHSIILKKFVKGPIHYIRIRSLQSYSADIEQYFFENGFRCIEDGAGFYTMVIGSNSDHHANSLPNTSSRSLICFSPRKGFKKSLRRASNEAVTVEENVQWWQVWNVLETTRKRKNIRKQKFWTKKDLELFFKIFSDEIIVRGIFDPFGECLAVRAVLLCDDLYAFDLFAGSTDRGLKFNAMYLAFEAIIEALRNKSNAVYYDLNGVDILNNRSVYQFKKGTGANFVRRQGQYEASNSKIFAALIRIASR